MKRPIGGIEGSLALLLLSLGGCSGHASREDQLNAAANQSTPEAANVLSGAAQNGMNEQAAINEAGEAQANNSATTAPSGFETRPNSAQHPSPPNAGQPPQKLPANSD